MAEEEEKKEGEEAAPPKKSKKKLIIIIVAVLVLVGGGAGAFLMMGHKAEEGEDAATEESGGEAAGGEEGAEGLPGAIVPLETFIVNLQVKGSFLKASVQLELATPEPPKTFEHQTPRIRDGIIRILSSKTASEILSAEGKEKLREELKATINETLGSEDVVQVYFTEFIIQ